MDMVAFNLSWLEPRVPSVLQPSAMEQLDSLELQLMALKILGLELSALEQGVPSELQLFAL